jgi:hypothetical protein
VGFVACVAPPSWSKAILTCNAPNSPAAVWKVGIGDSTGKIYHLLAFGIGASISCGPYILAPGENLVASVTGGGVSDSLTATLYGLQDVNPSNLTMDTAVGSASSVVLNGGSAVVSITGIPSVSISGTVPVTISSGTVTISGTVPVSIAGTINVNIASGTVAISGTVPVTISSGTVSITGTANISIVSQSITLATIQNQIFQGTLTATGIVQVGSQFTPATGTHAIGLYLYRGAGGGIASRLAVEIDTTAGLHFSLDIANPLGEYYIVPVPPGTPVTVFLANSNGGSSFVTIYQLLDVQALQIANPPDYPIYTRLPRYDGQGSSEPAAGTKATVTLAANASKRWVAHHISAAMSQISGAATAQNLALIDGASGGAVLLIQQVLAITAAVNNLDRWAESDLAYANGLVNTAMTLEFGAGVAGTAQRISLGAYLQ